jgi:hypothetical protein
MQPPVASRLRAVSATAASLPSALCCGARQTALPPTRPLGARCDTLHRSGLHLEIAARLTSPPCVVAATQQISGQSASWAFLGRALPSDGPRVTSVSTVDRKSVTPIQMASCASAPHTRKATTTPDVKRAIHAPPGRLPLWVAPEAQSCVARQPPAAEDAKHSRIGTARIVHTLARFAMPRMIAQVRETLLGTPRTRTTWPGPARSATSTQLDIPRLRERKNFLRPCWGRIAASIIPPLRLRLLCRGRLANRNCTAPARKSMG